MGIALSGVKQGSDWESSLGVHVFSLGFLLVSYQNLTANLFRLVPEAVGLARSVAHMFVCLLSGLLCIITEPHRQKCLDL